MNKERPIKESQCPPDEHDWDFFSKVNPAGHYCMKCGVSGNLTLNQPDD